MCLLSFGNDKFVVELEQLEAFDAPQAGSFRSALKSGVMVAVFPLPLAGSRTWIEPLE
jgi:hypothetical protein